MKGLNPNDKIEDLYIESPPSRVVLASMPAEWPCDFSQPSVPNIRHSRDSGRGIRGTAAVVSGCGGSETGD